MLGFYWLPRLERTLPRRPKPGSDGSRGQNPRQGWLDKFLESHRKVITDLDFQAIILMARHLFVQYVNQG